MSSVVGTIASVDGKFYIQDSQGNIREASAGDEIHVGEVLLGDKNNNAIDSIAVTLENGNNLALFGDEKQLFDTSLFDTEFAENETVSETESLESMFSDFESDLDAENEDMGDEENVDNIDTEAGEEDATQSIVDAEAEFAQTTGNSVDINADLNQKSFTERFDEEKEKNSQDSDNFELGNFGVYQDRDGDDTWVNINENEFEDDERDLEFNIALDAVNEIFSDGTIVENLVKLKNPTLSGTATLESEIIVTDENGNVVGRGETDENNRFEIELYNLEEESTTLQLEATSTDGREASLTANVMITDSDKENNVGEVESSEAVSEEVVEAVDETSTIEAPIINPEAETA